MNRIIVKAPAKINLALDVVGRREDRYHFVRMILQAVSVYDIVTLRRVREEKIDGPRLIIRTPESELQTSASPESELQTSASSDSAPQADVLPTGAQNLMIKALSALAEVYAEERGTTLPSFSDLELTLEKHIPISAGLAGGSTDAAAVLYGVNRLYDLGMSAESLRKAGLLVGADVPFCLRGGTCLAEGIGEKLSALPTPKIPLVLVKPPVSVSTGEVYEAFDGLGAVMHPDVDGLSEILKEQKSEDQDTVLSRLCAKLGNVLQEVTGVLYPVIGELCAALWEQGAAGAVMSGSGPTVFGLFPDMASACRASETLRKEFPGCRVLLAETTEKGLEEMV